MGACLSAKVGGRTWLPDNSTNVQSNHVLSSLSADKKTGD